MKPSPFIERTCPGKTGHASHLKRYALSAATEQRIPLALPRPSQLRSGQRFRRRFPWFALACLASERQAWMQFA